jgi:hypothetical protein
MILASILAILEALYPQIFVVHTFRSALGGSKDPHYIFKQPRSATLRANLSSLQTKVKDGILLLKSFSP